MLSILLFDDDLFSVSIVLICIIVFVIFNLPPFLQAMFQLSKEAVLGKEPDNGFRWIILYKLKNGDNLYLFEETSKSRAEKEFLKFKNKEIYYAMHFKYESFERLTNESFDGDKVTLNYIKPEEADYHIYTNNRIIYRDEIIANKERKKN